MELDRGGECAAVGMNGDARVENGTGATGGLAAADRGTLTFTLTFGDADCWNGSGWYVGGSTGCETTIIAAEVYLSRMW